MDCRQIDRHPKGEGSQITLRLCLPNVHLDERVRYLTSGTGSAIIAPEGQELPRPQDRQEKKMKLISRNGITTRADNYPYDVLKVEKGVYQFRAIGNPDKPVVIATTETEQEAIIMLILQAPDMRNAEEIPTISEYFSQN